VDDTVMLCKADSWEEIFKVINRDLQLIKQWLLENNLFLNFEKTVILHALTENTLPIKKNINIHNKTYHVPLTCSCESINILKSVKYLGIEICNNMKWKNQINILRK
jgi:hypothetical protein